MKLPPPPPNPTQDAQQDCIIETQQDPKELPEPCKIAPQKISFNQVVFKKIKRKLNHFIGNILARTEVYKNVVAKYDELTGKYDELTGKYDELTGKYDELTGKYDELTGKYDELTGKYDELTTKYESLLAKEANIKETFWERRADNEKEALFLEHFYLTSVYVATTAGYYLTPKGAKTFIEATERFKIIEPVDMFINNPTYHDVANFTYLPCPVSLNKHAFNSTIQNAKKPDISLKPPKKSYFDNLFYHKFNAQKCLKAFHKYSRRYAPLKTPKEVKKSGLYVRISFFISKEIAMNLDQLEVSHDADALCVVIEISKHSNIKYELDKESGALMVDRVLYGAQNYPANYGFVPNTLGSDGDPVDALVLSDVAFQAGSVVKARLVGVLNMEDESGMDEKLLALPIDKIDPTHSYVKDIDDLSKHTLDKIKHFFETYKDLEPNKWVKVKGFENKESAIKVLEKAIKAYQG